MNINNIIKQETLLLETYENNSDFWGMQVQNRYLKKLREIKKELEKRKFYIQLSINSCKLALNDILDFSNDEGEKFKTIIYNLEKAKL